MADGYLNFDTKINTSGFSKGSADIKKQLDSIKKTVLSLAGVFASVFSVKEVIENAAAVKAAGAQFEQTFGSMKNAAEDAMKAIADECGIAQTRLQGVGTSIYAFAKTTGMDSATALDMMNEALIVTADSAAYYDRSLEETAASLQAFLKGNYANDAALGLACTEVTRNTAANKLYGKSFMELSEAQKQLTLLQMVKDANMLSGACGQAKREAEGWENVTGNLKEAWRQLTAAVGQPVLAALVPMVRNITSALTSLTDTARLAASALSQVFGLDMPTSDLTAETGALSANADAAAQSYDDMASSAAKTAKANEGSLASFDKITKLGDTKSTESASAGAAASAGKLSLSADVDTEPVNNKFVRLFEDVKQGFSDIFAPLKKAWENKGSAVVQSAGYAFEQLKGAVGDVGSSFAKVWTNGTGQSALENILGIVENINVAVGALAANFRAAWNENDTGTGILQNIGNAAVTLTDHLENISGSVKEWAQELDLSPLLGSVQELSEAFEPFADAVGEGLEDLYDDVLLPLAGWTIEDAIPQFFTSLKDVIGGLTSAWNTAYPVIKEKLWDNFLKPIASWTAGAALTALDGLSSAFNSLCSSLTAKDVEVLLDLGGAIAGIYAAAKGKQAIDDLSAALKGLAGSAGSSFSQLWGTLNTDVTLGASQGGASFATKFTSVAGAAIGGWQIGSAIADAIGRDNINAVLYPIFDGFVAAWNAVATFFTDTVPEFFSNAWNGIATFFTETVPGFFSSLGEDIKNAFADIASWFSEKFTAAKEGIVNAFASVGEWFSNIKNKITGAFSDIGSWFSDKFTAAKEGVVKAFSSVAEWFKNTKDKITGTFSSIGTWFSEKFTAAWNGIKSAFSAAGTWASQLVTKIKAPFLTITNWFKSKFSAAWTAVKNVFSKGGEVFDGIKDGILDGLKAVVNALIDGINTVVAVPFDGINTALEKIKNISIVGYTPFDWIKTIDVPQIPRLATGTVVPANYGEFLAVLGDNKREAEVVAPYSTIRKAVADAMAESGGGKISVTIPIYIGTRRGTKLLSTAVIDDINDIINSTGVSPINI